MDPRGTRADPLYQSGQNTRHVGWQHLRHATIWSRVGWVLETGRIHAGRCFCAGVPSPEQAQTCCEQVRRYLRFCTHCGRAHQRSMIDARRMPNEFAWGQRADVSPVESKYVARGIARLSAHRQCGTARDWGIEAGKAGYRRSFLERIQLHANKCGRAPDKCRSVAGSPPIASESVNGR